MPAWLRPGRRGLLLIAGLALIGMTGLLGCQQSDTKSTANSAPATNAAAPLASPAKKIIPATVQMRPWPAVVRIQGSLMGDENAVIGAKVAGRIKQVKVDIGSVVQQGDVIAQLDSEEFDLRVAQAEAMLEQQRAKVGLKPGQPDSQLNRELSPPVRQEKAVLDEAKEAYARAEALHKENAATLTELQQKQALLRVAEARYAAALNGVDEQIALLAVRRTELAIAIDQQSESVLLAPFTCVVQERRVAPGMYVHVGDPIVTLVRTDPLRFRGGVPEREALNIELGQAVRVLLDDGRQTVNAQVSRISPALDMASRSLLIEIDVPNPAAKFRAGLFAEAEVVVDPDQHVLAVPTSAVIEFAGIEKVWLVEQGHFHERRVQTGRRSGDWVEIVNGLQVADRVAGNARQVRSGDLVSDDDVGLAGREPPGHGQSE
ncbi:MAG: efflux RND transporter periplasmic adaptor subunit [Planctomycetaceae bacterium]|nr:efflux RND transporter periplasmic adaptor subunit [Planctomycetaceae bacterium]